MFGKFTDYVQHCVVRAQELAHLGHDPQIDPLHLLAALLDREHSYAGQLLAEHKLTQDMIVAERSRIGRRGGITDADSSALQALGIDVAEVVRSIESTHGENALRPGRRKRFSLFGSRAHIPFAEESKRLLERSLREAKELGERRLRTGHLLLAMLGMPGVCADLLSAHGLSYTALRSELAALRAG